MNKIFKQFIFSLSLIGILLMPGLAMAALDITHNGIPLEDISLFNETSILPGDTVTRSVVVVNNDNFIRRIGTIANKVTDDDGLGSEMIITITVSSSGAVLYTADLADFFTSPIIELSSLGPYGSIQYDYSVHFKEGAGNDYQLEAMSFNIIVGADDPRETSFENTSIGFSSFLASQTIFDEEENITDDGTESDVDDNNVSDVEEENTIVKGISKEFLEATGFSITEFALLLFFVIFFFVISRKLRKKYFKN